MWISVNEYAAQHKNAGKNMRIESVSVFLDNVRSQMKITILFEILTFNGNINFDVTQMKWRLNHENSNEHSRKHSRQIRPDCVDFLYNAFEDHSQRFMYHVQKKDIAEI